ncbi:hypothetical protein [Actinomadura rudentiformis]|uniref:Ferredoxin n=1 Tax=Actinomadura rudentiformis TaxID=359158 RepID=A0A6H9YDA0_9ACTN|nr:hypothetical protein [Actinomadura rudentiformis]KAB2341567.1 hypothetical protein F8566_41235 [Actinomadura rudentiformis]
MIDERPEYPVTCRRCGACVLVRKNSLAHTEIQWTTDTSGCPELGRSSVPRSLASVLPTCAELRDSVEGAVREGRLPVPSLPAPSKAESTW